MGDDADDAPPKYQTVNARPVNLRLIASTSVVTFAGHVVSTADSIIACYTDVYLNHSTVGKGPPSVCASCKVRQCDMDVNITQDLNCLLGLNSSNNGPDGIWPGEFAQKRRTNLCCYCAAVFMGVSNYGLKQTDNTRAAKNGEMQSAIRQMQELVADTILETPQLFYEFNIDNDFGL